MGQHTITIGLNLNDKQEKMIDDVMKKLNGCFDYLWDEVLMHIIHSEFYYKFTDEERKTYDDLVEPIYQSIIEFETSCI